MKKILIVLAISLPCSLAAQDYAEFTAKISALTSASFIINNSDRLQAIDQIWKDLRAKQRIPFVVGDSVAFLYRGEAKSVEWTGDFNQWNYDRKFQNKGHRLGLSDVWILKTAFASNARLDYKILLNGSQWILDPENKWQQWSGVGGGSANSELRMPHWEEDETQHYRAEVPHGTFTTDHLFSSKELNYQVTYDIYVPAQHKEGEKLPVIYVTDGYEYRHPKMGNMTAVLDNLIADGKIKPIVAVFIDHRDPVNRTNNRRMEELAMNQKYLSFFTEEFIPFVETTYPIEAGAKNRAILGNSMGGLNSAYFVFTRPDVFSMAGIQSPAFYTRPQIYSLCEQSGGTPIKISMTSGTVNDTSDGGRKMKDILESTACKYTYREVNEGHSWGNWRNLIDDILIDLFAN